jgi:hypothetical protein
MTGEGFLFRDVKMVCGCDLVTDVVSFMKSNHTLHEESSCRGGAVKGVRANNADDTK